MKLKLWQISYADYKQGLPYKEIAEKRGVSVSTVKSWARRYWKALDAEQQDNTTANIEKVAEKVATTGKVANSRRRVAQRKRGGAPFGNQFAKGHGAKPGNQNAKGNRGGSGAPLGSQNALKTGEYSRILLSTFTKEETEIFNQAVNDPIAQVEQTIRLLAVREYRMLKLRDELIQQRNSFLLEARSPYDLLIDSSALKERTVKGLHERSITERKFTAKIIAMEEAITRVQEKKIKAIEARQRMLDNRVRVEISGPNGQPVQTQQNSDLDLSSLSKDEITALVSEVFSNDAEHSTEKQN